MNINIKVLARVKEELNIYGSSRKYLHYNNRDEE